MLFAGRTETTKSIEPPARAETFNIKPRRGHRSLPQRSKNRYRPNKAYDEYKKSSDETNPSMDFHIPRVVYRILISPVSRFAAL
jgi:hypothetical protein